MNIHLFHKNLHSNITYWFGVPELALHKIYYDGCFASVEAAKKSIGRIGSSGETPQPFGQVQGTEAAVEIETFVDDDKYSGTQYVIYKGDVVVHYRKDRDMDRYRRS
jgi:hypothetical protein